MILTDVIRLLPPALQRAQLVEVTRVGARAYLFCIDHGVDSQDDAAIRHSLAGWPLSAVEALLPIAESAGVTLRRLPSSVPGLHIFSVSG